MKNIDKRISEYKEWINKINLFSNNTILFLLIIGLVLTYIGRHSFFLLPIGIILFIYSLHEISRRKGHMEGYLDGYENALNDDETEK